MKFKYVKLQVKHKSTISRVALFNLARSYNVLCWCFVHLVNQVDLMMSIDKNEARAAIYITCSFL